MSKVKAPYNVNKLTSKIAIEAFQAIDKVEENIARVNAEKAKLIAALEALSPRIVKRILPSDANFLMFALDNATAIYKTMAVRSPKLTVGCSHWPLHPTHLPCSCRFDRTRASSCGTAPPSCTARGACA